MNGNPLPEDAGNALPAKLAQRLSFPADGLNAINHTDEPAARRSARPRGRKVSKLVVLPESYQPRYAYPLIVWLHAAGEDEAAGQQALTAISDRNYIGLAVRGDLRLRTGYDWSSDIVGHAFRIGGIVAKLSRKYRINPDRIYLAGTGMGGTRALQLLLTTPELWTGAANLQGEVPTDVRAALNMRMLRHKRVLLSRQLGGNPAQLASVVSSSRQFHDQGLDVTTRLYQPSGKRITNRMLREIDHWIMAAVSTAIRS